MKALSLIQGADTLIFITLNLNNFIFIFSVVHDKVKEQFIYFNFYSTGNDFCQVLIASNPCLNIKESFLKKLEHFAIVFYSVSSPTIEIRKNLFSLYFDYVYYDASILHAFESKLIS